MVCPNKETEFINEANDVDRIYRAYEYENERAHAEYIAMQARRNKGRYAVPSKRISPYIDKSEGLVGKRLLLEEMDGARAEEVTVRVAEPVGNSLVRINNRYTIDMGQARTTDGMYMVEVMGSEAAKDSNVERLEDVAGTVLADMDTLIEKTKAMDEGVVDVEHIKYLDMIFKGYRDTLLEAGKDIDVTAELLRDLDNKNNTRGTVDPKTGKMRLILGNQRLNGATEVLAHELQHMLIRETMKGNKNLTTAVLKLRDGLSKTMTYEVFLDNPESATDEDKKAAEARFAYVFENKDGGVAADEFLAYATTNKQLLKAMGERGIPDTLDLISPVKDIGTKTFSGKMRTLWNNIVKMINKIYRAKLANGGSSREYALDLLDKALELQYRNKEAREKSTYQKVIEKIANADARLAEYTVGIKKETKSYSEAMESKENDKMAKVMKKLWRIKGLARVRSFVLQNNIFSSLSRDMSNPDVAKFYQMFRHAKAFVENAVAPMKQATIDVLVKEYGFGNEKMSVESRRATKRVIIDTDAGILGDSKDILEYLEDEGKIDSELDEFANKYSEEMVKAVNDLGEMLVTNKMVARNGYANAAQINWDLGRANDKDMEADIDRAATLVALKKSGAANKRLAIEALKSNPNGIDFVISLKKNDEAELLDKAYNNDSMYAIKGAKQEKYMGDKKHYIVEADEVAELAKAKMVNLGKHEELSRMMKKDVYVMVGESLDVAYTEGLMTTVQLRNEGDSLRRLLVEMNDMTEEEAEALIAGYADETNIDVGEALIPERSGIGKIYDYRVRMPHEVKSSYMEVEDDIVYTIAETTANLTHKQEAMLNNRASLIQLNSFYEKYKNSNDFKFIEISEKSTGKFKEYWDLIPFYMKRDIKKGMNGKLMVEEGMLIDFFGYSDVSFINAPLVKNSKRRQLAAKKVEKVIEEIAKNWKHSVVAKTFSTVKGNMMSNMVVALQHTEDKNPVSYLKRFQGHWADMNDYKKLQNELLNIRIKGDAGEAVDSKRVDAIKVRMENNPMHNIIQDGQYTHIMEDINQDWFKDKGIIEERLDKIIDKATTKNGNNALKDLIDTLYIRKDSAMYDSTMKMTMYADAINKKIIEEDMAKSNPEMTEQERLNYVDQLHVNYGYLDNRWIKKANDLLVFTFTKYFFRVFPAMIRMLGRKGVSVFLTESAQGVSGIDAETPWDQFYNPFTSLLRKISAWEDPMNVFGMIVTPAAVR